jgi:DNA-directed RNA polymerase subunit RPC12/RpoP
VYLSKVDLQLGITRGKGEKMNQKELQEKIDFLQVDEETQKKVACSLIGHSNIQTHCFGYYSCARCGEQVGDALGGVYSNPDVVIVGHKCGTCIENYKKTTWKDTFMCPDPFEDEE